MGYQGGLQNAAKPSKQPVGKQGPQRAAEGGAHLLSTHPLCALSCCSCPSQPWGLNTPLAATMRRQPSSAMCDDSGSLYSCWKWNETKTNC